jgi:flagellar biosynthesis protein FliR
LNLISLSIPYLYLLHVLIISIRVGATLLFAPIWGYPGLPQYLRIVLVFSIAAGMSVVIPFNPAAYTNPGLILPVEFLIGLLLTMGIRIAFAGLHMGGQLLSYHLGFSAVQAIDPQTQNRSTLMSSYMTMLGYVIILASDQHHVMFRALADSYKAFPIGASISTNQWFDALMEASKQIFIIGWKIALPVFIATFVLEVTVGFIARMQPQINTMVVTAPLKILVGLIVLGASLAFVPRAIGPVMDTMVLRK